MAMVVLNGYFRSGTSILWQLLRAANPDRSLVYEPCHNDLFGAIELARQGHRSDLHSFAVWEDYLILPEAKLQKMRWAHPAADGNVLPASGDQLLRYVDVLQEVFGDSAVLQTNRWHFHLEAIARRGIEVLHVVRNPVAVYRSIQQGSDYRRRRNPFVKARALFNPADQFYSWKIATEISRRYGHRLSPLQRYRPFDVFIYCWVLANVAVLEGLRPDRVFSYEEICLQPDRFRRALQSLGLAMDFAAMRPAALISAEEIDRVGEACDRLHIERFWEPLRDFLRTNHASLVARTEYEVGDRIVGDEVYSG